MNLKISTQPPVTTITLSRSNVLTLLHKLEMVGSHRTIVRSTDDGILVIKVESDEEHYGSREEPRGLVHPDSETFIRDY